MLTPLRAARVLIPATTVLEQIGLEARVRARRTAFQTLASGLTDGEKLVGLLANDPDVRRSRFAWLHDYPESPLHLAEMATAVAPGALAVLLIDQAGWHLSDRLVVPPTITLLPLPAKCPELNPIENIWQFIRDNWLSKPRLPLRDRRSLLRCLEQTRRSAMAHHVHRVARLGTWVLITGRWCKSDLRIEFLSGRIGA